MVVDFRALNEKMSAMRIHPNITEILNQLGSKYFSVYDLVSDFHQMYESDAPKQLFTTPYEHYQFKRMLFDLKNIPATFLMIRFYQGCRKLNYSI